MAVTSIIAAITYAQQLSQTDANGIPSLLGLAFANDAQQDFIRTLTEHDINAAKLTETTASIVSGTGKYSWPSDLYALKTLEVNYTDNQQGNYIQPRAVDISNTQGLSFDQIRINQPTQNPLFNNYGPTFEIFPTPTGSNSVGLKYVYYTTPTEYADVGAPIVYPATLDYRLLGAKIAALYKTTLGDYTSAETFNAEYDKRVKKIVTILAPQSQQPITPEKLHITGFEF